VKYTNTAFWNGETESYDIVNFGFFNLASMSRLTESRRPIVFEWDRTFLDLARRGAYLAFDYELYRSLSPAMRRFYLIANRDGWNQRDSSLFIADDFTVHQIGYNEKPQLRKLRLQKLKRILAEAERLGLIQPFQPWNGYLEKLTTGPRSGELALRWGRGPMLRARTTVDPDRRSTDQIENDALYAQVRELRDEGKKAISSETFRQLVTRFGRETMQKHVAIVLAQKEHRPSSFQKREVAAFINRMQHNHPEPDWYQDLRRAERLARFDDVAPSQLSMDAYGTFFRDGSVVGAAIPRRPLIGGCPDTIASGCGDTEEAMNVVGVAIPIQSVPLWVWRYPYPTFAAVQSQTVQRPTTIILHPAMTTGHRSVRTTRDCRGRITVELL
jgi:hypothetical protein